jgi:hypothetical protein
MKRCLSLLAFLLPGLGFASTPAVCPAPDEVVMACEVGHPAEVHAICAKSPDPAGFYAVQKMSGENRPGVVSAATLHRSHLGFAGNTGGYAFSVTTASGTTASGTTILYNIEGSRGLQDNGVIVQDASGAVTARTRCAPHTFQDTGKDTFIRAALKLPADETLERHGLPGKDE